MKKRELFLKAMQAQCFLNRAWSYSAFALTNEAPNDWRQDPYPYRIVRTPAAIFYVDPQTNDLAPIEDVDPSQPLYTKSEMIFLAAEEIPNARVAVETTYGNVLFNYICLIWPFGSKIDFLKGRVSASQVEAIILERLVDDPAPDRPEKDDVIYVKEYLRFADAMVFLTNFTQLFVPAGTSKTLVSSPRMNELKNKLLKENAGRLHDPAVIAKIEAELIKEDREWLKGDPGENFLISKKSINIVRKKLFGMYGAEPGLEEKVQVDLVPNSLEEGWDPDKFVTMVNTARAGSFFRSAQTELGGEAVKALLRASANINIIPGDCGTKLGMVTDIDGTNYKRLIGYAVVSPEGYTAIDKDNAQTYVGKQVMVRSPMFCKSPHTDRCEICAGSNLAANPDGASVGIAAVGSDFLAIFMSAAHSKGTTIAKMNVKDAFL